MVVPTLPPLTPYCLVVDGELYSATLNNFLGTEPVIQRNLGPRYSMKTEFLPSWLNGEEGCAWVGQEGARKVQPGLMCVSPPTSSRATLCGFSLRA